MSQEDHCTQENTTTGTKKMAVFGDDALRFESTFLNVSWSDIMDAEESEDPVALERLK